VARSIAAMTPTPPRVQRDRLIWVGLGLTFAFVLLAFGLVLLRMGASLAKPLPVLKNVADFTLTNQLGQPVSLSTLKGHPWVADIIFTRCAGPCLRMSRQMKELQSAFPAGDPVRFVSLTTDPEYDTPAVLRKYGERFGSDPNRWLFLTGTKAQIAQAATNSMTFVALEKDPKEQESAVDLFIHSTVFLVIDKEGRMRGVYETGGEDVDPRSMKKEIITAVRKLERER